MAVNQNFSSIYKRLIFDQSIQLHLGGSDIDVQMTKKPDQMSLSSSVYEGGNYIPHSVRKCIAGKMPFGGQWIATTLVVDEEKYQIRLQYEDKVEGLNLQSFKDLLEEFSWQADEWRLYLEEHDKHDLVYVYSR